MIWTKEKPKHEGYYWLRMEYEKQGEPYSNQPPRVVRVSKVDDGYGWNGTELMCLESPDYEESGGIWLTDMSRDFEWSSDTISVPAEVGSCNCADDVDGWAACHACPPE